MRITDINFGEFEKLFSPSLGISFTLQPLFSCVTALILRI